MPRLPVDARREEILRAAIVVLRRQGIAAMTVRDVAAEAGISSGLIHHYVASMDELVAAAFERVAGEDLAATRMSLMDVTDPIARLRRLLESYVGPGDGGSMQLWLDAWSEAARRPALRRISRALNEDWQRMLADVLREGAGAGVLTCPDAEGAAWRILSLLDGLMLQVVAHGDVLTVEQVGQWSRIGTERELDLLPGTLAGR